MNNNIDEKIKEMGARIRELRELEHITIPEMAQAIADKLGMTLAIGIVLSVITSLLVSRLVVSCLFAMGLKDAKHYARTSTKKRKVDVTELIEGSAPRLRSYDLTRAGNGRKISQAHGMTYYNMADAFQNRIAEPLYVRSIYDEAAANKPIEVTSLEVE